MGQFLRVDSTASDTYTTEFPCTSVALSATVMQTGASVTLPSLTNPSGDHVTWLVTIPDTALPDSLLYQTLKLKYLQATATQKLATFAYADVLDYSPASDWLTTIYDAQQRLRTSSHGREIAELIDTAHALVSGEEGIGGAIFSTVETENVVVGNRARDLKLRNIPIGTVTTVADPYGAAYSPSAFVVNAGAGLLSRYFISPGQNLAASMFGAQNEALLSGSSPNAGDQPPLLPGTWNVTYSGGKELDPRWDRLIRPDLTVAVLLTVEAHYNARNGFATAEHEGDKTHTLDTSSGLPPIAKAICRKYSLLGV